MKDKIEPQLDEEEIDGEVSEIVRVLPNREPHQFFQDDFTDSATRNRLLKQEKEVEELHNPFKFESGREFNEIYIAES